jgi:hypothetical protein
MLVSFSRPVLGGRFIILSARENITAELIVSPDGLLMEILNSIFEV